MDIDTLMNRFRLASRELFNRYFHSSTHDENAWVAEERFSLVQEQLFRAMVTEPAGVAVVPYYELQPDIGVTVRHVEVAPWLLNRETESGYWDHPKSEFDKNASLRFESFFDWDQVAYRDNLYVRVQVVAWKTHPELVGKSAQIENQYVRFVRT